MLCRCRLQHLCLVCKGLSALCFEPELLRSITVSTQDTGPALQRLHALSASYA